MKSFHKFILESRLDLPPLPGSTPIPSDHVRLYHQTSEDNLEKIRKYGIRLDKAKGVEGPKSVYADEKGFYGSPESHPTIEFSVPKDRYQPPFVKGTVEPKNIHAVHYPWHSHARYMENDSEVREEVLAGRHGDIADPHYQKAIRFIKLKYGKTKNESTIRLSPPSDSVKRFMDDYHSVSSIHPSSPNKRIIGNAVVELHPMQNHVHFSDILSLKPGSGAGGNAVRILTDLADKHGVVLKGFADPYKRGQKGNYITQQSHLDKFYKKRGFKIDKVDGDTMATYTPKPQKIKLVGFKRPH